MFLVTTPSLASDQFICKNSGQTRLLKIKELPKISPISNSMEIPGTRTENSTLPPVCQAIYVKQGAEQVIGQGSRNSICYNFLESVRKNLQAAHWVCRKVKSFSETSIVLPKPTDKR
ncbi:MAG: hypothetical protein ACOYOK_02870 [Pseudobdellovibrionaceae bacterium]